MSAGFLHHGIGVLVVGVADFIAGGERALWGATACPALHLRLQRLTESTSWYKWSFVCPHRVHCGCEQSK
jgi:hypothetical protein